MTNKEIYDRLREIYPRIISDRMEVAGLTVNTNTETPFGEGINNLATLMLELIKDADSSS